MRNIDGYVTNIVYGVILLLGYNFLGILPTILGFLTWFVIDKYLESRFSSERKAEIVALVAGVVTAIACRIFIRLTAHI